MKTTHFTAPRKQISPASTFGMHFLGQAFRKHGMSSRLCPDNYAFPIGDSNKLT
jgi:hypothetical protein